MSNAEWSTAEKAVAKAAVGRAKKRADEDALKAFRSIRVGNADDLWKLEQQIRGWKKDRDDLYLTYEEMEDRLARWIRRGWLTYSEISGLDEARLKRIRRKG